MRTNLVIALIVTLLVSCNFASPEVSPQSDICIAEVNSLVINSNFIISGEEQYDQLTIHKNGKLIITKGSTLQCSDILLNKGSLEVLGGTIIIKNNCYRGNVGIFGEVDRLIVSSGSLISIKGSDGHNQIGHSNGNDAIIDLRINKEATLENSAICVRGGNGYDLSDFNAWSTDPISGYASAGGNATINLTFNTGTPLILIDYNITSYGGNAGNAANGGNSRMVGGVPSPGIGGGYVNGANIGGYVGVGGDSDITLTHGVELIIVNSTIMSQGGNGGDGGDGGHDYATGKGAGGGGYCGGNGQDPGPYTASGHVGSGGHASVLLQAPSIFINDTSVASFAGDGGDGGNGGNYNHEGGGGGGGYGGGGGGSGFGGNSHGGDASVEGYVGSGGNSSLSINATDLIILSGSIQSSGGAGGWGGSGGVWITPGLQGGGGGGGYGGGGGGGRPSGTGGTGTVGSNVGHGGNSVLNLSADEATISKDSDIDTSFGWGGSKKYSGWGRGGYGGGNVPSFPSQSDWKLGTESVNIPKSRAYLLSPSNQSISQYNPVFKWLELHDSSMSGINSTVTQYQLQVDNDADLSSPIIDETTSSNTYSHPQNLTDGDYYWRIQATYSTPPGVTGWSETWKTTVITPPIIYLISPNDNDNVSSGTILDFNVVDNDLYGVNYSDNSGSYVVLEVPFDIDTENITDGHHTFMIIASDIHQTVTYENYSFYLDGTEPSIILVSPNNHSVVTPGIILDFDVTDALLESVKYKIDDDDNEDFESPYDIETDQWDDGVFHISVNATDLVGHSNTKVFNITIDSVDPLIYMVEPTNNSRVRKGTFLEYFIIDENIKVSHYSVNSGTNISLSSPYLLNTTTWTEGYNEINIFAIDKANNTRERSYVFHIDGIDPSLFEFRPMNESDVPLNTTIYFKFSEPMNRTSVENGLHIMPAVEIKDFNWNHNYTNVTLILNSTLLQNSTYSITLNATITDLVGNPISQATLGPFQTVADIDYDGILDSEDNDNDNDGILDMNDAFPLDPSEAVDTDQDGIGDNADPDDDNDGIPDEVDDEPLIPYSEPVGGGGHYWWVIALLVVVSLLGAVFLLSRARPEAITTLETEECPSCGFEIEPGMTCPFCPMNEPKPEPKPEPKTKLTNEEKLERLEKAYKEGRMSEEQYLQNRERFGG